MGQIGSYIIRIVATAIICGIITKLVDDMGPHGAVMKLLCSVFLILTLVIPISGIRLSGIDELTDRFETEAQLAVEDGTSIARSSLKERMIADTEAYILDKAEDLGATVTAEVELSESDLCVPASVRIVGYVSPYAKKKLKSMLSDELGIEEEDQEWICP